VVGLVAVDQLKRVPRDRWAATLVRELMRPLDETLQAAPGDALWDAFKKLAGNGVGRLAVLDGGAACRLRQHQGRHARARRLDPGRGGADTGRRVTAARGSR
jgi:hypothetical protein